MSQPFIEHSGAAAPLPVDNVDTDQIIPSREMTSTGRSGLADGLFSDWRYEDPATRQLRSTFVLNRPRYRGASILVSGTNFGCGSSREHAVWALAEYGIRAIIAVSFGEIFHGNCIRNGLLPITLEQAKLSTLVNALEAGETAPQVRIDLPGQTVQLDGLTYGFEIEAYAKRLLVEGLDPIGLTLKSADAIARFQAGDQSRRPWIYQ